MASSRLLFGAAIVALVIVRGVSLHAQSNKPGEAEAIRMANVAFQAGVAASREGRLEDARTQFAKAVHLAPQIPEGHEALGQVLTALGRPVEALPELDKAAWLKPKNCQIEVDLGRAYAAEGETAGAVEHFATALELGGGQLDAGFFDSYARALAALGKRNEALKEFAAEEKLAGPTTEVDDAIGTVEAQLSRWDEAKAAFERSLQESSTNIAARIHLGVLLRQQHDLTGALAVLEPTAPLNRSYPAVAWLEYGRTLAASGQDEAAIPVLDRALELDPKLPRAAAELAMALQRLGRQEEAIPWFEKALELEPHDADVLANLGLALTLTGKAKEALSYLAKAHAEAPNSATIVKDRGVAHIQLSAFDEAIEDFKAALALDPNDPALHYDLGLAFKFKDRMDEAVAELSKAGEMNPALEDPPYTLGILYMQMGKLGEAASELKMAVALRPDNGNAWAILGSTLKQDGRLEEAREALEKAVLLQPGQPGPLVTLAGVLADEAAGFSSQADAADAAGDTAKAEQLRAQSKELRVKAAEYRKQSAELSRAAVNRQRANFALNAGNQLLLKGQIADAVSRYQESVAADPTFADPHAQLAVAYDRQGRIQDAAAERARATELGSGK
jgi:tetratricopeptide (TPR) repeat protein